MRIERLCDPSESEFRAHEALWEASVRATHGFLNDRDVVALRPEAVSYTHLTLPTNCT